MTNNRAADSSIKGYYYQFNLSILEILEGGDKTKFIIEGIEDIDKINEGSYDVIQCKYYSSKNYTPSILKDILKPMIIDFSKRSEVTAYKVYLYTKDFSGVRSEKTLTMQEIKSVLTYYEGVKEKRVQVKFYEENDISDEVLEDFSQVFKVYLVEEFEDLMKLIKSKISYEFDCDNFEADVYYFNNALRTIIDLARESEKVKRTISKQEFIKKINKKEALFTKWYLDVKGKEEYVKSVISKLGKRGLNISVGRKEKILVLGECFFESDAVISTTMGFLSDLIIESFGKGKLRDSKPWIIVVDTTEEVLNKLKSNFIDSGTPFNDGYESIRFSSFFFNKQPFLSLSTNGNQIKEAAYLFKILRLETYLINIKDVTKTDIVINVSNNNLSEEHTNRGEYIDIKYIEEPADLRKILLN